MATGRRRSRAIIYLALILILVVILGFVLLQQGSLFGTKAPKTTVAGAGTVKTAAPTQVDEVNIVYTAQEIHRGQIITDDLVAMHPISRKLYSEGLYFTDIAALVSARAKSDLRAGVPLETSRVLTAGTSGSIPSFEIPTGKVAISIPISKLSSVAYGLQKGDHVNVIASLLMVDVDTNFQSRLPNRTGIVTAPGPIGENQTYVTALVMSPEEYKIAPPNSASVYGRIEIDPTMNNPVYVVPSEPQRPRLVSQTLLQDIIILQLGNFNQTPASEQPITAPIPQPGQPTQKATTTAPRTTTTTTQTSTTPPDVVTLIVSPQDAVTLNYLMLSGANLNMVLRSAGDNEVKNTEAVTLQFILDQYQIPNPAKLPYGLEPRIDQFPNYINPFPEPAIVATPTKEK